MVESQGIAAKTKEARKPLCHMSSLCQIMIQGEECSFSVSATS
jgi:hypothetical protein